MKQRVAALLSLLLLLLVGCSVQSREVQPQTVLQVAVASSLEPVVKQLVWSYQAEHRDVKIQLTAGPSGALARQIEQGAAFDLFLSAGEQEMQQLVQKHLVAEDTIKKFLANRLVVVVPEGRRTIKSLEQLKDREYKQIAIADPTASPAGRYAKQALEKSGVWQELQPKLAYGKTVRDVLSQVTAEKVQAGIVYRSDAVSDDKAHIALEIDDKLHEPIRYPMAVLKASQHPNTAKDFLDLLESPKGKDRFERAAFQVQ